MKKSLFKNKNSSLYNNSGKKLSSEIETAISNIIYKYNKKYYLRDIELIVSHSIIIPISKIELGLK